jgi:MFS transporter, AAHS family, 4-hydroxybenzoate transporter
MMSQPRTVDAIIDERPVGRYQMIIAIVGAAALFCDGFDIQILSYLMPQIAEQWHIAPAQQGTILSSSFTGMMIGFLAVGPFASKIGPKRLVVGSLVAMGLLNIATVAAEGVNSLVAFRLASGVALGGIVPPTLALAAEFFPSRNRSTLITSMYLGTASGFMFAGASAWALLPTWGWHSCMIVGGILPLAFAILVQMTWPESYLFLLKRGAGGLRRIDDILSRMYPNAPAPGETFALAPAMTVGGGIAELFRNGRTVGTLMLWLALCTNAIVYFFALSWLPLMLVKVGASHENAILASTLGNTAGLVAVITGVLMDKFGNARVVMIYFISGAAFVLLVGLLLSPSVLVIAPAAFCLGFCVSGLQKGVSALTIAFYPPASRSTGLGWVLGIGRFGAILGPMIPGFLLQNGWQPTQVFYFMAIPLLIGGVGIAVMRVFYTRKPQPDASLAAGRATYAHPMEAVPQRSTI